MKRREFLQNSLEFIILSKLLQGRPLYGLSIGANGQQDYLVIGDTDDEKLSYADMKKLISRQISGYLCTLEIATGKVRRFPVPIWAHVYTQHPTISNRALAVGKWTNSGIFVDLKDGTVLKTIMAPKDYRFFGHAIFHRLGRQAYFSIESNKYKKGGICVYNAETWQIEKIIDIGLRRPHECVWLSENQIVTTGQLISGPHNVQHFVVLVDVVKGKVERTFSTPRLAHIVPLGPDRLAMSGGNMSEECQLVVFDIKTGHIINAHSSPDFPKAPFRGECLSLVALSPNELAVTELYSGQLLLWNTRSNRIKLQKFGGTARGLSVSGDDLYLSYGPQGHLTRFRLKDGMPVAELKWPDSFRFGNGSHMRLMRF